jgi:iron-sulfur cluster repair protein YtfE (RIC family)
MSLPDSPTLRVPQLDLPGQSHVAAGPHDLSGMYVMHHAFRRDLDSFVSAVRRTPVGEAQVWAALTRRWSRFEEVLHHHHVVEDTSIWPTLISHAEAANAEADRETLEAMEAEHAVIDPALSRTRSAFEAMAAHPCIDHRNALDVRLTALRQSLADHLRHEETRALPIVQRTMTAEEWAEAERAAGKGYPARLIPFLVPWVAAGLPADVVGRMLREAGPAYGLVLRLCGGRYHARERVPFRYAD